MTKRVLDVGNCAADHGAICRLLEENFDAEVVQAHDLEDTLAHLSRGQFDLVLVNRKLDRSGGDGIQIIKHVKSDSRLAGVPCMLVTNYADHQQSAVEAGAELGFGKLELDQPDTLARLQKFLGGR